MKFTLLSHANNAIGFWPEANQSLQYHVAWCQTVSGKICLSTLCLPWWILDCLWWRANSAGVALRPRMATTAGKLQLKSNFPCVILYWISPSDDVVLWNSSHYCKVLLIAFNRPQCSRGFIIVCGTLLWTSEMWPGSRENACVVTEHLQCDSDVLKCMTKLKGNVVDKLQYASWGFICYFFYVHAKSC